MPNVTWEILPGRVRTHEDSVQLVIDHDDVKIWEIDLDSKYPSDPAHVAGPEIDRWDIYLYWDEDTIKLDDTTTDETIFRIRGLDTNRWNIITEPGRYTIRVVAYTYHTREEVVD